MRHACAAPIGTLQTDRVSSTSTADRSRSLRAYYSRRDTREGPKQTSACATSERFAIDTRQQPRTGRRLLTRRIAAASGSPRLSAPARPTQAPRWLRGRRLLAARSGEAVDRGNDARPAGQSQCPDRRSSNEAWVRPTDRAARLSGRVADRPDVRGDLAPDRGRWRARQRPDRCFGRHRRRRRVDRQSRRPAADVAAGCGRARAGAGRGQSSTFPAAIATGLPCSPRSWARRRWAPRRSSACRAIRCLASNMWPT